MDQDDGGPTLQILIRDKEFPPGDHRGQYKVPPDQALRPLLRLLAHLNQAETLAKAIEDQGRLARSSCYLANCFTQMDDRDHGIEFAQRALAMAIVLGDFAIQVQTNYFLGQAYYSLGDYRLAMEVVRRNVACLEGDLLRESFGQGGPA